MPLSKRRLKILAKERKQVFSPVREFDNGTNHPVVIMSVCRIGEPRKRNSWMTLMCPCDLKWRWEKYGNPPRRTMIMTGGINDCPANEDAREIVRDEVRAKNKERWSQMSLADSALDIWLQHSAGEYLGEHNVGTLYVQDLERLLGTTPDVMNIHLGEGKNANGEVVSPAHVEHMFFPSKTILAAIGELKKRKLIDLNGMILVPYKESFRFPEQLHHQFAYWIEEPLGWPNGDAGDYFMGDLYRKIAKATRWISGEHVFSTENIPRLTEGWLKISEKWVAALDERLADKEVADKSEVLREIPLAKWISWLASIRWETIGLLDT